MHPFHYLLALFGVLVVVALIFALHWERRYFNAIGKGGQRARTAPSNPGAVRTGMTGGHGNLEPDESAPGLLARIDELRLEVAGRFLHQNGDVLPS
jgi:hypothetical protein